ncbi:uncharacterized protein AMSG_03547 [Thecamonas trahens ATCC 50062]|uniref:Uncharacterized protein n=1 Tax=Thecamonas trahens ATCC 50062 TaxID=461836 RepID=A0A0L0D755_THETB|nr:hypothetical protein AMSG_03547 [Thecamonas trahens ATCC 50062]KNC47118.1 hypothetical protein AMSG_03547 [Thecamonas trahens ATCC 50062]|eukprot:XP_013759894.1 hypothetical protein AMSG_03547 [Thecamonas trahens ATCC 50062]
MAGESVVDENGKNRRAVATANTRAKRALIAATILVLIALLLPGRSSRRSADEQASERRVMQPGDKLDMVSRSRQLSDSDSFVESVTSVLGRSSKRSKYNGLLYTWSDTKSLDTFRQWAFIKECYAANYGYESLWDTTPADVLEYEISVLGLRNNILSLFGLPVSESPYSAFDFIPDEVLYSYDDTFFASSNVLLLLGLIDETGTKHIQGNAPMMKKVHVHLQEVRDQISKHDPLPSLLSNFVVSVMRAGTGPANTRSVEAMAKVILDEGPSVIKELHSYRHIATRVQQNIKSAMEVVFSAIDSKLADAKGEQAYVLAHVRSLIEDNLEQLKSLMIQRANRVVALGNLLIEPKFKAKTDEVDELSTGSAKGDLGWYNLGPQWSTLSNMFKFFERDNLDFVWMTGGDQYLQRTDVDIADFLDLAPDKDIIIMDEPHWPQQRSMSYGFGGMVFRNTPWARAFIARMFAKRWRFLVWDDNSALTETILEVFGEEAEARGEKGYDGECMSLCELDKPYGMSTDFSKFAVGSPIVNAYSSCFFDNLDRLAGPYGKRGPKSKLKLHNMLENSLNLNCWSALTGDPRMDLSWCMTVHFNGLGSKRAPLVNSLGLCNNITAHSTSCFDYQYMPVTECYKYWA